MPDYPYVPLRPDLLARLIERYGDGYDGVIEHQIEDFLERTEGDWDAIPQGRKGYMWDQLFLPNGTHLRTRYYGDWQVAIITDGEIQFNGNVFDSPAKACNSMRGGTSNNAWLTMEVKRPQDPDFRPADHFRRR